MTADKREHHPIRQQLTTIKVFLTRFDKANRKFTFTRVQYRRAWEYAVKLHKSKFAVNHM
jgi:hypothetical protein